jgi:nicotinamide-nucleotide amidase
VRVSIITVGDEIVSGHTTDTNSTYLANRLGELGFGACRMSSVGDDVGEIAEELKRVISVSDLVFVTGGLGPTDDDVTAHAVAEATGRGLVVDRDIHSRLVKRFKTYASVRPEVIENLARVPEAARTMENPVGAAPGIAIESECKRIYVLPGVPPEMKAIFEGSIVADLAALPRREYTQARVVRTTGLRESEIAETLGEVLEDLDLHIGFLPRPVGVDLRLSGSAATAEDAAAALDEATRRIVDILGSYAYSTAGEDFHLVVGRMLIETKVTIAVAESCTGGLIGHLLTDVPGISACLERDIVAYSNQAKVENLGVDESLIEGHGAVSPEVAEAMACGIRQIAHTDLALATTGIAGPAGGTETKPVGLVYVALAHGRGCQVTHNVFRGTREIIKLRAAIRALDLVRYHLLEEGE